MFDKLYINKCELLLCKEERTNGVTEGEIHLKESELPNEQMD